VIQPCVNKTTLAPAPTMAVVLFHHHPELHQEVKAGFWVMLFRINPDVLVMGEVPPFLQAPGRFHGIGY